MDKVLFSSKSDNWSTPQQLFDELDYEFGFTLDPCADETNYKCEKYYTKEQNGLSHNWKGETVFCNSPYGREVGKWVEKCYKEYKKKHHITVVMLLPARTDTKWFHDYIYHEASKIRFIKGRLRFGNNTENVPFPSMVVIYD